MTKFVTSTTLLIERRPDTETFSLRRYDANGRPDEENGDWKVDVIEAL